MFESEVLRAIILGVVQGIAEFLPISSSGHLVIADALMEELTGSSFGESAMSLNVALHVGSLFSILLVFWKDIIALPRNPRLCALIVVASVPVAVAGLLLKDVISDAFNEPLFPAIALLGTAFMLVMGQRWESGQEKLDNLPWRRAFYVGLFQAVAIIPGISRSGSTIAGGLLLGLDRNTAARFSFLLAIAPIAGAGLIELLTADSTGGPSVSLTAILAGTVTSFAVGYLSLSWLLRLISQNQLHRFATYCVLVSFATVAWRLPIVMSADPASGVADTEGTQTPDAPPAISATSVDQSVDRKDSEAAQDEPVVTPKEDSPGHAYRAVPGRVRL